MNKLKLILGFAFLWGIFACNELADNECKITFTGGEHFPKDAKVSLSASQIEDGKRTRKTLAEGAFVKGRFEYNGVVESPVSIIVNIAPAMDKTPYKRMNIVLEAGETDIAFSSVDEMTLKGGRLNDLVFNSWNDDVAYRKALKDFLAFSDTLDSEAYKDKKVYKQFMTYLGVVNDRQQAVLHNAFEKATDFEKLFFYQMRYRAKKDYNEALDYWEQLAASFVDKPEGKLVFHSAKRVKESIKASQAVAVGKYIKPFTAQDSKGATFHLKEVLAQNKYVLVEFWASWCGPCRGEIPHMKKAYQKFHNKHFEIVSFTLDEEKEKWEQASKEEQLPWIDTGDLKGFDSPVAKMYGVLGIPNNFLVEASTGKILAVNLRGERLDEKLKELLD